jgi:hypothetical protein
MARSLTTVTVFIGWVLLVASPGAAQIVTGHSSSDEVLAGVSVQSAAQGRIGDRGATGDFELGFGQTVDLPLFMGQLDWVSGETYDWTLIYERQSVIGVLSFELGGFSGVIPVAPLFNSFFIRTAAELPNTRVVVTDLVLGQPPSAGGGGNLVLETASPGTPASSEADGSSAGLDILKISGFDLLDGFKLKGRVKLVFAGADPPPAGEDLSFQILVADDGNPPGVVDSDGDGIPDDGNGSGVVGDAPCADGVTEDCDDNCKDDYNPDQADSDVDGADGLGDVCDNCPEDSNPLVNGKQPNEDGDKFGDACDNCPLGCTPVEDGTCKIDDGTNTDGDMWGDRCDNCPGIPNDDQADDNGNGKGDLCDDNNIVWDNLPVVAPLAAPVSVQSLAAMGGLVAAANGTVTTVELSIDGATDVAFANIGINLSSTGTTFIDFSECLSAPGPNPNEQLCTNANLVELGPTISTASSVIGPGIQSVSFPWLAGSPSVSGTPPNDMVILQLRGKPSGEPGGLPGDLICEAQTENNTIGVLRLQDFVVGSNPLSTAGFSTFDPEVGGVDPGLSQLVGPTGPVPNEQVVFQVNPPGSPLITLQLRPTDNNPDTHYELSMKVDSPPQYVARIAFGLTASDSVDQADMSFGGCQAQPVANAPPGLVGSLRGCQGSDPNLLTPRADDGTSFLLDGSFDIATYTVGPEVAPGDTRLPNTLYVAVDSGYVEEGDDALNDGGDQWLGVVVFSEAADPPQITFQGTAELPGYETGPVVAALDEPDQGAITGQNVTLSNTASSSSDSDGDGNPDDLDNCVRVPNAQQDNTGGVGFVTSAANFDRIGDVCQCGDPGRDGVADNGSADVPEGAGFTPQDDVVKCQKALAGEELPPGEGSDFCKVTTTGGGFSIVDILVLEADTAVPGSSGLGNPKTGSLQSCGAAEGL